MKTDNLHDVFQPLLPEAAATPTPRRKRGPTPKPSAERRSYRIAVYLLAAEMRVISGFSELSGVCPATYLRKAALSTPPVVIPELNKQVWEQLGRSAANLNQIAKSLNSNDLNYLIEVRTALIRFRQALVEPAK